MKHLIPFLLLLAAPLWGMTQNFQPLNPGFELWDNNDIDAEPSHWNSFASSDGQFSGMASSPHHYHRHGGRPGTDGTSFLTIYTKSILGIKANGNMTTGRIHAGSMSATSSDNYNYTQRSNTQHSQAFAHTPDSMYVWVSYYAEDASSKASITCVIHGDNDFKDPNEIGTPSLYAGRAVAQFARTTSTRNISWRKLQIPFVYDGSAAPAYLLISLASNMNPGSGSANDSLSVDDFEFVYSSWLTGLSVDGQPVSGFDKGRLDYYIPAESMDAARNAVVTWVKEVEDSQVETDTLTVNDSVFRISVRVVAEDGAASHTYRLNLYTGLLVGMGDAPVQPSLRVYPNPAGGRVCVEGPEMRTIIVRDLMGRVVKEVSFSAPASRYILDLDGVAPGVYILSADRNTMSLVVE